MSFEVLNVHIVDTCISVSKSYGNVLNCCTLCYEYDTVLLWNTHYWVVAVLLPNKYWLLLKRILH